MREFHLLIAVDTRTIDLVLGKELVEQQAGTGIGIPIHKSNLRIEQSAQRGNALWIPALHHQAHFAGDKADYPVNRRSQPALARVNTYLPQFTLRQMHARELAPVVRQRDQ